MTSKQPAKTNASRSSGDRLKENHKQMDIQTSNILAAKAVADLIRTSLGPRGMDKMIRAPHGENFITNDGATIMEQIKVQHPIAKMLVEVSKAQDAEVGDGTTSVVVIAGALLGAALQLLERGIHPQKISEGYFKAARKAEEILISMALPVDLTDRESLIKSAITSLNSKVVSQYSNILAPIAVDAVLKTIDPKTSTNVDLKNIHVTKKLGGTVDDTELIEGIVFTQKFSRGDWPSKVTNAKIALIQFHLSPPKTQMDNCIVINDYAKMDRVLREERNYILNLCKTIQKSGCNVLLIQKAILRDATTDLSLQYLAKLKIMVVNWVDRGDMNFVCKALGCIPIPNIESFRPEKFGRADLVEEVSTGDGRVVKITGIPNPGQVVSILCRGSNNLMLDESERSLHDALCVVRSLVKKRYLIAGGGAPEMELAVELEKYSKTLAGSDSYCVRAFADALEVIPYTLAENAGLNPISIVTELRNRHAAGEKNVGINVKKGIISDILQESVIQPLLVSTSAISLATEVAGTILKIDDILMARR